MRKVTVATLLVSLNMAFAASSYTVHNLISDIPNPGGTADPNVKVDPNLVDPWGIALSAGSPFWISNAGTGTATVYSYAAPVPPATTGTYTVTTTVVKVPSASGGSGRVTGQIAGIGAFALAPGQNPNFLFCTEDGTLSGWNRTTDATNAKIMVDNSGKAVYKGCTAVTTASGPRLYAANFLAGTVDVFDTNWKPVTTDGGFNDPNLPGNLKPFNVWALGNKIYVAYAVLRDDGVSDQPGRGNGQVNVFDVDGNLLQTFSDSSMNSPWGMEIAPEFFGDFSFALLVGNFGDGRINAFDTVTGAYLGTLSDSTGKPLVLEGLWALQFGNNKSGGDGKLLYFTAGISGGASKESHGLFGYISFP